VPRHLENELVVHSGGLEPFMLLHIIVGVSLTVATHHRLDRVILVSLLVPVQKVGIFTTIFEAFNVDQSIQHHVNNTRNIK
jgi:hypothetical protein